jgi:hypothetical protein
MALRLEQPRQFEPTQFGSGQRASCGGGLCGRDHRQGGGQGRVGAAQPHAAQRVQGPATLRATAPTARSADQASCLLGEDFGQESQRRLRGTITRLAVAFVASPCEAMILNPAVTPPAEGLAGALAARRAVRYGR